MQLQCFSPQLSEELPQDLLFASDSELFGEESGETRQTRAEFTEFTIVKQERHMELPGMSPQECGMNMNEPHQLERLGSAIESK